MGQTRTGSQNCWKSNYLLDRKPLFPTEGSDSQMAQTLPKFHKAPACTQAYLN